MWQTQFGQCIHTSPSGYKVYQNPWYRWLTFGNDTLQTLINRSFPQRPVLYYLQALTSMVQADTDTCCLLGLGGAGVLHVLASQCHSLVAVDKEIEVIDIAKQFFMLDRIPHASIVHANALDYVRNCSLQFHHLLIDLYNATHYPMECSTDDFFLHCKNALKPDGFMSINLANSKEHWPIFQLLKHQFESTLVIPIKKSSNVVIIASKNTCKHFFLDRVVNNPSFKKIEWRQHWGYVAALS